MTGRPIKTYEITVEGFGPALYSGRTPGRARARCWREYRRYSSCSFRDFLGRSRLRVVPNPPGIGDRICVAGLPATRVIGHHGQYVAYMRDNHDDILLSHPADVTELLP